MKIDFKLKRNPFHLRKYVDNLIASGKIQNTPPWYAAVSMYPMAPQPTRHITPSQVGQFNTTKPVAHLQLKNSQSSCRNKQYAPRFSEPEEIIFPEDEIRNHFYKWHPFELLRPKFMMDDQKSLKPRDWSTIYGGDITDKLTGENVVQHTLFLMSEKGGSLSRPDAYAKALDAFYKERASQEQKELKLKQIALEAGANSETTTIEKESLKDLMAEFDDDEVLKKTTNHILRLEHAQILDGNEFSKELMQERDNRKAMNERMNFFEKRKTLAQ